MPAEGSTEDDNNTNRRGRGGGGTLTYCMMKVFAFGLEGREALFS